MDLGGRGASGEEREGPCRGEGLVGVEGIAFDIVESRFDV